MEQTESKTLAKNCFLNIYIQSDLIVYKKRELSADIENVNEMAKNTLNIIYKIVSKRIVDTPTHYSLPS
jgi:hypothetical protein